MNIFINDEETATNKEKLDEILQELNYQHDWIATAVNGHVIPKIERKDYQIKEGDHIEVLSPMQGG